ncbi:MarR family winged helix-turn-helix transcriptional regulator [Segnochrobactrum spirostomi]|uniref:MarR family transcriptional regulator n=1 Tax=Segnochrobactrum spirostomi TaxID=2608987 RepID=A0A6A7Y666_9HYPH|nr:MarR family transcriptional regulator [Segnochrobactrum spirostomi]MQT14195.1 MarR family transcriptional regulator [Segnochrobactrum spirostomi]
MTQARLLNLLGALALSLGDAQAAAMRGIGRDGPSEGLGPSACAAIVTLGPYPGTSIGRLAKILGLTHSVAVRLVEQLTADGLVARRAGDDRRQVLLALTPAGEALRGRLLAAREAALGAALRRLSGDDVGHLERLLATMLENLTESREQADHICRLCNEDVCSAEKCPVEQTALACEHRTP